MTTPPDSASAAGRFVPGTDPAPAPQSQSRREMRGLIGLVVAVVVLCLLTAVAFNVVVTRSLHSPYPLPDTHPAPATPPAAAPGPAGEGPQARAASVPPA